MRRATLSTLLFGATLVTTGCAPARPVPPVMPWAGLAEPCRPFYADTVSIGVQSAVVRAGDTAPLGAFARRDGSTIFERVPAVCLSDWRVSPQEAATVSPDGTRVTFAPGLPSGTTVTIGARTPNQPARAVVVIAGPDEARLVGRYSQLDVTCDGPLPRQPVRELRFSRDGHFAVTWTPFERYEDYWGDYMHDPETGRMTLTVTGGNRPPDSGARLSGTAELRSGESRLVMDGFYLGDGLSNGAGQSCRYVFAGPSLQ